MEENGIIIDNIDYDNHIVEFRTEDNKKYCIPSPMFPLPSPDTSALFFAENTKALKNAKIEKVYNLQTPEVGQCFSNVDMLYHSLIKDGHISRYYLDIYAGWLFNGFSIPVFHCIIVYKNVHILDLTMKIDWKELNRRFDKDDSLERKRDIVASYIRERNTLQNSQKTTFGKMSEDQFFIASKCQSGEEARIFLKNLLKIYPQHVCYCETNHEGMIKTQEILKKS